MSTSPFSPYFTCAYAFQSTHLPSSHHRQTTQREEEDSQSFLSSPMPRDHSYLYTAGDSAPCGVVSTPQKTGQCYQHHHRRLPNRNKCHPNHVPQILLQIRTRHQHQHLHHQNPTPSLHQHSAQLQCSGAQSDCDRHIILSTFPVVADCHVFVMEGNISLNDMSQHIIYLLYTTTQTDVSDIRNIHNRTRFGLMIFAMLTLHRRWKTHCGSRMGINCIKLLFI